MAVARAEELLDLAMTAAERAGQLLLEGRTRPRVLVDPKSSATDMVTEMDRSAEALIRELVARRRPDDAWLGEEGGAASGTSGVRWVVDPLDGTTNYLSGYPQFSVSIAVEIDDATAVGVVHDPSRRETFSAVRGGGAFVGGRRLELTGSPLLATALVGTGFSYVPERRTWQAAVLTQVISHVRDIRRGGSAALDLAWLAAGRLDAFYELGLQPWDMAAGALIASEAGAVVATLGGGTPPLDVLVAAPAHLDAPLRALLAEAGRTAGPPPL
jgi:myo-inositol-1(or 4)-monophosphatase